MDSITASDALKAAVYSKSPYPMVFMAFAYQWGVYGKNYYPINGMQAIPDAAVKGLESLGGELKLNTEVIEILVKENKAYGVKTKDGAAYMEQLSSNASPQFTYEWIYDKVPKKKMKKAICGKKNIERQRYYFYLWMKQIQV